MKRYVKRSLVFGMSASAVWAALIALYGARCYQNACHMEIPTLIMLGDFIVFFIVIGVGAGCLAFAIHTIGKDIEGKSFAEAVRVKQYGNLIGQRTAAFLLCRTFLLHVVFFMPFIFLFLAPLVDFILFAKGVIFKMRKPKFYLSVF